MPTYRVIVEGSGIATERGSTGFFTMRQVRAADDAAAGAEARRLVATAWSGDARGRPHLTVVDAWRPALLARLRRLPDGGSSFFDGETRADAASLEAEVARAPRGAAIWRIAQGGGAVG